MEKQMAGEVARVFVVLNPVAGSCTAEEVRSALERHFGAGAGVAEVYETTGDEVIAAVVNRALEQGADRIIAAGGDGTVSEVAGALVHTNVPLGIIPVGTANVLAHELGIPLDLDAACALLAGEHTITNIDAMRVGDRFFVLQIGIGIDALMIRDTEREHKRRFGRAAYLWTAFSRLIGFQPRRFTIAVDGERLRPRAAQVLIANGGVLGIPPFRWGPDIRLDDGQIDVCIVSARTAIDYLGLLWHTLLGQHKRDRNVRYLSARQSVTVSSDHPLPVQGDGEIIGETPVRVEVVPGAMHVIVPLADALPARESAGTDPNGG